MRNHATPYNLVKLKSINFENEVAAVWIHIEKITGESIGIPLDFLSKIEFSGQKEI